jgi:D-sedoheptulose 7-phosphate isomerase
MDKINSKERFSKSYKKNLVNIINGVSDREISDFIDVLLEARRKSATVYFIGNGGSASTASHFVNDLSIGTKSLDRPFRAISLCDNQAVITAIANDYGYEYVFSKQLSVLLKENDVVVAISASGNSPNLIQAFSIAKNKAAVTVGISAFDGGKLKVLADVSVYVPTKKGEYGPAEDVHLMLDHLVTGYLMKHIRQDSEFT